MLKLVLLVTLVLGVALAGKVPAQSIEAHLIIKNMASADVVDTSPTVGGPEDWVEGKGVMDNARHLEIVSGTEIDLTEEMSSSASANYFALALFYADGSTDRFSANLRSAVNGDPIDFKMIMGTHRFTASVDVDEKSLIVVIEG